MKIMTVSELIKLLTEYPADMRVAVNGYKEEFDDLEERPDCVREIGLDARKAWLGGQHREAEDTRTEGDAIVNALVLNRPMKLA